MNGKLQKCSYLVTTLTLAGKFNPNREDLPLTYAEKKVAKKNTCFCFAFTFHTLDAVLSVLAKCSQ